jgi:hypothetical protein
MDHSSLPSKLIQVLLSGVLVLFTFAEIIINIKFLGKHAFNTRITIQILMLLSLICNSHHI